MGDVENEKVIDSGVAGNDSQNVCDEQDAEKTETEDHTVEPVKGFFIVLENPNEPFDIQCQINPNAKGKPPKEYQVLYNKVESCGSIIKSLNKTEEGVKRKYFNKLLSLAQAGLVSEKANPELAEDALKKLKEEIVLIEGRRIKNQYMKILGLDALIGAGISLLLYAIFQCAFINNDLASFMLLGIGAMAGTWVSFGARKMNIGFEELSFIEKDMMEPVIRLVFIYLATIIMALFLMTGIVQIKIGTVDTANMLADYKVPLVVGAICGLVESRIGVRVYKQANTIIGE